MSTITAQNTQAVAAAATAVAASSSKGNEVSVSTSDLSFDHTNDGAVISSDGSLDTSKHEKKFECSQCHKRFTRKQNLISHEMIHKDLRPYFCPTCERAFRRKHDMRRHQKLHLHKKPFVCSKCGRSFSRGDALLRHEKSQSGCSLQKFKKQHRVLYTKSPTTPVKTNVSHISTHPSTSSTPDIHKADTPKEVADDVIGSASKTDVQGDGKLVVSNKSEDFTNPVSLKEYVARLIGNTEKYISLEHKREVLEIIESLEKRVEYLEHKFVQRGD